VRSRLHVREGATQSHKNRKKRWSSCKKKKIVNYKCNALYDYNLKFSTARVSWVRNGFSDVLHTRNIAHEPLES
jgi:hypothetical protein